MVAAIISSSLLATQFTVPPCKRNIITYCESAGFGQMKSSICLSTYYKGMHRSNADGEGMKLTAMGEQGAKTSSNMDFSGS